MSNLKTVPYWVIINYKKHTIWKQPYSTYMEAKLEFDLQAKFHPNHTYEIEQRERVIKDDVESSDEYSRF